MPSGPTASRTAQTTSRQNRIRFSRLPPYASVRRLAVGDRNAATRNPNAARISTPSIPPLRQRSAAAPNASTISAISPTLIAWARWPRRISSPVTAEGAHTGAPGSVAWVVAALWPSWARMTPPSSWTVPESTR